MVVVSCLFSLVCFSSVLFHCTFSLAIFHWQFFIGYFHCNIFICHFCKQLFLAILYWSIFNSNLLGHFKPALEHFWLLIQLVIACDWLTHYPIWFRLAAMPGPLVILKYWFIKETIYYLAPPCSVMQLWGVPPWSQLCTWQAPPAVAPVSVSLADNPCSW